jgi:hypothetical protein
VLQDKNELVSYSFFTKIHHKWWSFLHMFLQIFLNFEISKFQMIGFHWTNSRPDQISFAGFHEFGRLATDFQSLSLTCRRKPTPSVKILEFWNKVKCKHGIFWFLFYKINNDNDIFVSYSRPKLKIIYGPSRDTLACTYMTALDAFCSRFVDLVSIY